MMWLSILLLMLHAGTNRSLYWQVVRDMYSSGCRVYDYVYLSCPDAPVPFGMVPIPEDAVETPWPVHVQSRRRSR